MSKTESTDSLADPALSSPTVADAAIHEQAARRREHSYSENSELVKVRKALRIARVVAAETLLQLDFFFREFFSENNELLKAMFEDILGRKIKQATLLPSELLGASRDKKHIRMDIPVELNDGTHVDIEMQINVPAGTTSRFLFYACREYAEKLAGGENYAALEPAISVIWLAKPLFPELKRLHSVFELRERHTGFLYSEHLVSDAQYFVLKTPDNTCARIELTLLRRRSWLSHLRVNSSFLAQTILNRALPLHILQLPYLERLKHLTSSLTIQK